MPNPKNPATGEVRARVDRALKATVDEVLDELGIDAGTAIRLFYDEIARNRVLPFPVRVPNAVTRKALRDADEGKNLTHYPDLDAMFKDMGS